MNDITIKNDKFNNIVGIGLKKIKLDSKKLTAIRKKASVNEVVKDDVVNPVLTNELENKNDFSTEEKELKIENSPSFLYSGNSKKEDYAIDDNIINAKVSKNYGGYKEPKIEKKQKEEVELEKTKITEVDFEKLLNTKIVNSEINEQFVVLSNLYSQRKNSIKSFKNKQAKLVDEFQKVSNEEQIAKIDNDAKKNRLSELKKQENFKCLEVGANEDARIIEAVKKVNDALQNLFSTNKDIYNETKNKIDECASKKIELEKVSSKIREEIKKQTEDLSDFMVKSTPLLEKLIEADNVFKKSKEASQRIEKEYEKEFPVKENFALRDNVKEDSFKEKQMFRENEPDFNSNTTNLFDVLRRSTPDIESTQELNIPTNRQAVVDITSEVEDFTFGARRAV